MNTKIAILICLIVFAAACSSSGTAESEVANGGYDSVAYFAADRATKGNPQFAFVFNGAKWLFSSKENLEKFKSTPEEYIPQLGAHCPVSLANGGSADGSPTVWKVVDKKLYLFNNEDNKREFEQNSETVLKKASENFKSKAD